MSRRKYLRLLLVFLTLILSGTPASYTLADADLERIRLTELRRAAEEVRKIIEKKDIPAFLTVVRADIRPEFEPDLSNPSSALYGILFDSEVLRRLRNSNLPSISVRDFFLRKDPQVDVSFYADGAGKKRLDV